MLISWSCWLSSGILHHYFDNAACYTYLFWYRFADPKAKGLVTRQQFIDVLQPLIPPSTHRTLESLADSLLIEHNLIPYPKFLSMFEHVAPQQSPDHAATPVPREESAVAHQVWHCSGDGILDRLWTEVLVSYRYMADNTSMTCLSTLQLSEQVPYQQAYFSSIVYWQQQHHILIMLHRYLLVLIQVCLDPKAKGLVTRQQLNPCTWLSSF